MNLLPSRPVYFTLPSPRATVAALLLLLAAAAQSAPAQYVVADAGWRDVTLAEYAQHLQDLEALVSSCQEQRAVKAPAPAKDDAYDPKRVGPDDRVHGAVTGDTEPRQIRYDWLRSLLSRAGKADGAPQHPAIGKLQPGETAPPSVDALLGEARQRLQDDEQQAAQTAPSSPSYSAERQTLNSILAQRAYQGVTEMTARERFLEWLANALDKILASLVRFGSHAPWIVWTLRILLIVGIGTGLVWALIRIERSARVKMIPDVAPSPGAPSAREWQLWLKDAQAMAAENRWREAIHFVYWASIARLESRRLWPADRARTPREYLALLPGADPRKPSLTVLTGSFERTWYGGRAAASSDFKAALEMASELGVRAE